MLQVEALKTAAADWDLEDLIPRIWRLEELLREGGQLSSVTLDALITAPVSSGPPPPDLVQTKSLSAYDGSSSLENRAKIGPRSIQEATMIPHSKETTCAPGLLRSVASHIRSERPFEVETDETYLARNK